jgi:hypothetical protein
MQRDQFIQRPDFPSRWLNLAALLVATPPPPLLYLFDTMPSSSSPFLLSLILSPLLPYLQMSVKTHERSDNCRGHTGRSVRPPDKWDSRTRNRQHKQDNRSAVRPRQADLVALVGAAMGILVGVVEGLVKSGSFFGPPLVVGDNLPWDSWPDRHPHPLDARGGRAVRDHHAPGRRHLGSLLGFPPADPSCGCLRVHRDLNLPRIAQRGHLARWEKRLAQAPTNGKFSYEDEPRTFMG